MASIGRELKTKGVIMALLTLVLMNIGCEDKIDSPAVNLSEGETVEVTLNVGFADEEDGTRVGTSPASKAGGNSQSAFEVLSVANVHTKADEGKSDQLYNLEIIQYNSGGSKLKNQTLNTIPIGSAITVNLQTANNCKLLLIAHGKSNYFSNLSGLGTLTAVQTITDTKYLIDAQENYINNIAPEATGSDLADMPYYLLLNNVNITSEGKIQSPEGSNDVRLLLKRLAVRLTLDWNFAPAMTDNKYTLKEVKLCQVPAHYRLIPQTEATDKWGEVYPTSVAEFVDIYRLTGEELSKANGTKTVWIPANARGISSYATSPIYRNKENANAAATYAEFVVDNSAKKERLYYRAYLGGNETNDFNLLENTNYHWTVNINKANYTNDPRIQLLDQTPVKSANLQPTSNCFMMVPGTNICFNPYKHTAGTDGWNTNITDGNTVTSDKTITSVKILWQTKDAGTSGNLVMGYVIDNNKDNPDHKNLVNLTDGSDKEKARIHVKVPVTNGGNAVVAACNSAGIIVWSWHLWITDYVPQGITSTINYTQAQEKTRGGSVHQYATSVFQSGIYKGKVMMDRNLCATGGGFPGQDASNVEFAKRYGFQYQWGRKDPFFCSADGTTNEIKVIYNGDGEATKIDMVTYGTDNMVKDGNTLLWTIQHPTSFIKGNASWYNGNENSGAHINLFDSNGEKTLYDPCPNGWTLIYRSSMAGVNTTNAYWYDPDGTFKTTGSVNPTKGGRLHNLSGNTGTPDQITIHNTGWYPVTSFRGYQSGVLGAPTNGYLGFRDLGEGSPYRYYYMKLGAEQWTVTNGNGQIAESVPYRCIQE